MKKSTGFWLIIGSLVFGILLFPRIAVTDSSTVTGTGAAQARVTFRIVIPPSLFLQVQSSVPDPSGNPPQTFRGPPRSIQTGRLEVQANGSLPDKGVMHLATSRIAKNDIHAPNTGENNLEYRCPTNGVGSGAESGNSLNKDLTSITKNAKDGFSYHVSEKFSASDKAAYLNKIFILCSP